MLAKKLNETIEPLCSGYSEYALLDFPAHSNVGDSAIYLGELAIFDRIFNRPPSYVCTKEDTAGDIGDFTENGIIFIHGGGNFGDIWPAHQIFLQRMLKQHPNRKIVQLPQSINFSTQSAIDETARAIAGHPDFTLLVRDYQAFEFAEKHFDCLVKMCPDAAYALGDIDVDRHAIKRDVLCLLRSDKERKLTTAEYNIWGCPR